MNQMSRHKHSEVASYATQYSKKFVERWDDLIDWDKRKAGENGFFENLLKQHGVKSVIDVSTGSGFHAVQLKQAGFDVVATDGSSTMLTKARENFRQRGLAIESHYRDWPGPLILLNWGASMPWCAWAVRCAMCLQPMNGWRCWRDSGHCSIRAAC